MKKYKNFVYIILIFTILIYYILGFFINNKIYASTVRHRESNLDELTEANYPGVATLINELKRKHPNWTFTILYTGLDWSTVIYNETEALHSRSLVQKSSAPWICSTCGDKTYDNGTWRCASKAAVAYYMDVRNWLTENNIFTFETLSYDWSTQTIDGVKKILAGTFMEKESIQYYDTSWTLQTLQKSYAQIIMDAAQEVGISPYHLASRLKQEQGIGDSGLISGNYTYTDSNGIYCTDLVGYYNYFNIRASGSGNAAITQNGLNYAKSKGWTTPELAIKGGATFLASEYISNYQDCLYLEKYQVDSAGGLYSHQYMQNISAPYTEGSSTYNAYKNLNMLDYPFNFIIPVYENMPTVVSPIPGAVTMDIVTENVKVTTEYAPLKIRQSPSVSSSILASVNKGTVILRIEKARSISDDGRYWDKVVYNSGTGITIGYSARTETNGDIYLTSVDDVVTTNEEAVTNDTDINLRNGPGLTSTTIIKTLGKDVPVTIIDKITFKINDYYWYRVKLADGTQGYIAAQYLAVGSGEEECYKIDEEYILVTPTTVLNNIEGATLEGEKFVTGAKLNLGDKSYNLVILGDVNGDGNISPSDFVKISNKIMGANSLLDVQAKAADVNRDGSITPSDFVKVSNHIMGSSRIKL